MIINNSESKLGKIITVIFVLSAAIGLVYQIIGILLFTKTKLGKRIRKGVVSTMYDVMDESIDEAAIRAPQWMAKLSKLG